MVIFKIYLYVSNVENVTYVYTFVIYFVNIKCKTIYISYAILGVESCVLAVKVTIYKFRLTLDVSTQRKQVFSFIYSICKV